MENILIGAGAFLIFLVLLGLAIFIVFLGVVYRSAKNRGRDAVGWMFLSFFLTPMLCLAALVSLGETKEKWEERIVEEELLRMKVRNSLENKWITQ